MSLLPLKLRDLFGAGLFLVLAVSTWTGCGLPELEESPPVTGEAQPQDAPIAMPLVWAEEENFEISSALREAGSEECAEYRWVADALAQGEWLAQCRRPGGVWERELRITRNWYRNNYRVFDQPLGTGF